MMHRKKIPGTTDVRIVQGSPEGPEDIGRVADDGSIVYPGELGLKVVQSFNACDRMREELDEAHEELARRKATRAKLQTVNLDAISRSSDKVFTHIRFEDYDLREALTEERKSPSGGTVKQGLNWLEFGECRINNEGRQCSIGGRMRSGITDWEHDTPYVVSIGLLGLKYIFTESHVSHFEAHITPDPNEIKIYSPDFVPEECETAAQCEAEHCDPHLTIKAYVPPVYELAHVVAGKRVAIAMGPRWSALEKEDDA
jgi:hypothetical protein